MTIRLFLFDLDGTLVDTAPDLALAVNMVRTARGIAPLPEEELRPYASRGAPGLLGKAMGIGRDDPAFLALRTEFLDNCIKVDYWDIHALADARGSPGRRHPDGRRHQ